MVEAIWAGVELGFAIPEPNEYPVVPGFGDNFPGKSRDPGIDFKIEINVKISNYQGLLGPVSDSEPQKIMLDSLPFIL